jgi:uncharacterized paraquat-inducible protein A
MPTVIECPGCNKRIRIPDECLGRWVKCPACGMQFELLESSSRHVSRLSALRSIISVANRELLLWHGLPTTTVNILGATKSSGIAEARCREVLGR